MNIFNADGILLYSSINPLPAVKIPDRAYFQEIKAHPELGRVFSDPLISRTTKKPTLIMARRVLSKEGKFLGTVQAYVTLDRFVSFYQALNIGAHGVISMRAISGFHRMARYTKVPEIFESESVSMNHPLKPYYDHEVSKGTLVFKSPVDNIMRKVSFYKVPDYPFYVDVGMAKEDYQARFKIRVMFFLLLLMAYAGIAYVFVRKVTESSLNEAKAHDKATHDALTGLPNRTLFFHDINNAVYRAKRDNDKLALLYVDLDGFKEVNDRFGHDAGDDLLKEVAQRLKGIIRDSDTIARMGGDEFTIVLNNTSDADNVSLVAHKIITALSVPFDLNQKQCSIGASIGIAFYPENAKDYETLLKQADMAMYLAKQCGKNTYRFYRDIH